MRVCGQEFSPAFLQRIQQTVDGEPSLSRRALSRRVCGWLSWRTALGRPKEVSCRVALGKLEGRGELHLPAVRPAVVAVSRRVADTGGGRWFPARPRSRPCNR
jgi:hypothetical protein